MKGKIYMEVSFVKRLVKIDDTYPYVYLTSYHIMLALQLLRNQLEKPFWALSWYPILCVGVISTVSTEQDTAAHHNKELFGFHTNNSPTLLPSYP